MHTYYYIVALFAFALNLGGCASNGTNVSDSTEAIRHEAHAASKCAVCAAGKDGQTGWCDKCNAGYVQGKKYRCKACYDKAVASGEAKPCDCGAKEGACQADKCAAGDDCDTQQCAAQ